MTPVSSSRRRSARWGILIVVLAGVWPTSVRAQEVSVHADRNTLRVKAPRFHFIQGELLDRLKDGRSVRVDLELSILPRPDAAPTARGREAFLLSYDLWEERLAVAQAGASSPAVTHLTTAAAEAWCISQLGVPLSALGALGREATFWLRLEYRVPNGNHTSESEEKGGLTLRGLIEALSRRPRARDARDVVEAGPFRIPR